MPGLRLVPGVVLALVTGCDPVISARGMVRDSSGAGVARATVTLWVDDKPYTASTMTDSVGYFELTRMGSTEGRVTIEACHRALGMAQAGWQQVREIPDTVVLTMVGPGSLSGRPKC